MVLPSSLVYVSWLLSVLAGAGATVKAICGAMVGVGVGCGAADKIGDAVS
jgi:hypothetical protein